MDVLIGQELDSQNVATAYLLLTENKSMPIGSRGNYRGADGFQKDTMFCTPVPEEMTVGVLSLGIFGSEAKGTMLEIPSSVVGSIMLALGEESQPRPALCRRLGRPKPVGCSEHMIGMGSSSTNEERCEPIESPMNCSKAQFHMAWWSAIVATIRHVSGQTTCFSERENRIPEMRSGAGDLAELDTIKGHRFRIGFWQKLPRRKVIGCGVALVGSLA